MDEQQYETDIKEIKAAMQDIRDQLLDPDNGLYKRVADNTRARQIGTWLAGAVVLSLFGLAVKLLAG